MMRLITLTALLAAAPVAMADDWVMHMTVDNQFDAYFGGPNNVNFLAGSGNNWPTTYTFNAFGRAPTDYLYVSTSSDQSVAQGFIGDFTNTTTNMTTITGDAIWEVFPAGAYLPQMGMGNGPWPPSLQPTMAQVNTAVNYATNNNLWVQPVAGGVNGVSPWGLRSGIDANARWIWHSANGDPDPTSPGFNHDEFLIFRIAGAVPTPGACALSALALAAATRRRR